MSDNNDNTDTDGCFSSSGRWLVVIKAIGSGLNLSLFRPSREALPKPPPTTNLCDGKGTSEGARKRGLSGLQTTKSTGMRQSFSLLMTWADWEQLGYGPLQWMSHAQKMLLARLSLSWVYLKAMATSHTSDLIDPPLETVLQVRPTLVSVVRTVGTPGERSPADGGGCSNVRRMDGTAVISTRSAGGVTGNGDERRRRYRVVVRDEGRVFRVELKAEVHRKETETEWKDEEGGSSQYRLLEQTFGKEAWRETGLGELLWMDRTWRQYLADRLSKQVRPIFIRELDCFYYSLLRCSITWFTTTTWHQHVMCCGCLSYMSRCQVYHVMSESKWMAFLQVRLTAGRINQNPEHADNHYY